MRTRHRRALAALYEDPVRADLTWREVLALFHALGAEVLEGRGSRVRVSPGGIKAVLHRPHPEKELGKAMVRSIRDFLSSAGVR